MTRTTLIKTAASYVAFINIASFAARVRKEIHLQRELAKLRASMPVLTSQQRKDIAQRFHQAHTKQERQVIVDEYGLNSQAHLYNIASRSACTKA
jgi:adenylate kinase